MKVFVRVTLHKFGPQRSQQRSNKAPHQTTYAPVAPPFVTGADELGRSTSARGMIACAALKGVIACAALKHETRTDRCNSIPGGNAERRLENEFGVG